MRYKKYKPGDRIFYECYPDNHIETSIVASVEEKEYRSEKGYTVHYQWLNIDKYTGIENYNCLPQNDSRVREISKQYAVYDKAKKKLQETVLKLLGPYNLQMKQDFLKTLQVKLEE